jgi:hypothetical protein
MTREDFFKQMSDLISEIRNELDVMEDFTFTLKNEDCTEEDFECNCVSFCEEGFSESCATIEDTLEEIHDLLIDIELEREEEEE